MKQALATVKQKITTPENQNNLAEIDRELIYQYKNLFKGVSQVSWCITSAFSNTNKARLNLASER